MRTLFFIPLCLMSLVLFPSWGLTMDDLVMRDGLTYQKFNSTPFSGEVEGIWSGSYKEGKREGYWVDYEKNGNFSSQFSGTYKNGVKVSD